MRTFLRWAASFVFALFPVSGEVLAQTSLPLPVRPSGIAFDSAGDLFFTDAGRHQVYEVTLAGTLTLVAGTGTQGFAGDGGPATVAQLNEPHGIAVSGDGTIYIADSGNSRVRAVRGGVISTVAGKGTPGYSGDGGAALSALLNRPIGLAISGDGSLYIADSANQRVRVVRSGVISSVAGNGVQGFSGDGGLAIGAELNGPTHVAVGADGTLITSDSGNVRLRSVSPGGLITTVAGSGVEGFAGDGGPAVQAGLSRPQGVAITAAGDIYFADSSNHRLRVVRADGSMHTVAGMGVQGASAEGVPAGSASFDGPEGVAISPLGLVWFADARNRTVRAVTGDSHVFQPAGLVLRSTSLAAQVTSSAYGTASLLISVQGQAGAAQGTLSVWEGSTQIASATVSNGAASVVLAGLSAGAHAFMVRYSGDTLNPSGSTSVSTAPVNDGVVLATADAATMHFGDVIPALTGTLSGVAAQDAGRVQVSFTTSATSSSPTGAYIITATLSGPAAANYVVQLSPASGELTISPAASTTAMLTPAPSGYAGLPLSLSANVSGAAKVKPTGSVAFVENGIVLATASVVNGSATAVLPTPAVGQHAVVAQYSGDGNFLASQSGVQAIAVNTLPDFTLKQVSTETPTISPGTSASFSFQIGAAPAPFTGAVAFATTGLPSGWTARFAPSNVVPGSSTATVVLTVTASGTAEWRPPSTVLFIAFLWIPFALARRRRSMNIVFWSTALLIATSAFLGCGDRVASTADLVAPHPASFTVTGTATNLAGQAVTHSVVVAYLQP